MGNWVSIVNSLPCIKPVGVLSNTFLIAAIVSDNGEIRFNYTVACNDTIKYRQHKQGGIYGSCSMITGIYSCVETATSADLFQLADLDLTVLSRI